MPLGAVALGEDGGFRHDIGAGLVHDQAHALQRAASGNHIIEDGDALAGDQAAVFFVKEIASAARQS